MNENNGSELFGMHLKINFSAVVVAYVHRILWRSDK